jgi:hypothetical protein
MQLITWKILLVYGAKKPILTKTRIVAPLNFTTSFSR